MVSGKWTASVGMAAAIVWAGLLSLAGPSGEEKSGRVLEKKVFIHFRGHPAKPQSPGGGRKPTEDAYYAFLAKGCRWKTVEPFVLNTANGQNLSDSAIASAVGAGMEEWAERDSLTTLDSNRSIFGPLMPGDGTHLFSETNDGFNTISFGPPEMFDSPNIIAITYVWGYFSGPMNTRQIVEADILFNELFAWGVTGSSALMDLENIATHELGHVAGMADLYNSAASKETMYGYSSEGDTIKRDLYNGDILGIKALYGE